MKFKKLTALTVSALLTVINISNTAMALDQQPITDGSQKINANKLDWIPVSEENPLGGADDFSGILFNEFKNFNETGGPIAAGSVNNVGIVTFDEGLSGSINQFNDIVIPKFNVGIMVQNDINKLKSTVISNGDGVVGDKVNIENLDFKVGNNYIRQKEVDKFLEDAKLDLVNLNKNLWNREVTGDVIYNGNTVILNSVKGVNVFEVDLTEGRKNIQFNYPEDAKDSTIIIKYKGDILNYGETFVGNEMFYNKNIDNLANRVIWVVDPDLKELKVDRTIINGSVLAPNTNIILSRLGYSAINGTIIANGLDGSGTSSELHWIGYFKGKLADDVKKAGSFNFDKKDNYGKPIIGAAFALYQGDEVKYTGISNNNVLFNDIKPGTYILREISAPDGYEISKSEVEVTVSDTGEVTFKENGVIKTESDLDFLYVNKISRINFTFNKVIAGKDTGIPNVEFKLLQDDNVVKVALCNENGTVTFSGIELGRYTLVETTPNGYKEAGPWIVDITKEGAYINGSKLEKIENVKINNIKNSIEFIKYSDNKSVLSNATFELLRGKEVIMTSISDKNGIVRFENILPGEYIVREKSAPKGYVKSEAIKELVVKDNGEISITNLDIKEWEEAFINKKVVDSNKDESDEVVDPEDKDSGNSGGDNSGNENDKDSREENSNNTVDKEEGDSSKKKGTEVPNTSDEENVILPSLTALISLAGIVLIRKIKY